MAELLRKPLLPEYCEGEIHDFLVELIRKEVKNIPDIAFIFNFGNILLFLNIDLIKNCA